MRPIAELDTWIVNFVRSPTPTIGVSLRHHESSPESSNSDVVLDGAPGRPNSSNRFTMAQLRYLVVRGYYVFPDEEAQAIYDGFVRDYLRPSIHEDLTPNAVQQVLAGEITVSGVPSFGEPWNGMSLTTQREMMSRLADALLHGCDVEQLTPFSAADSYCFCVSLWLRLRPWKVKSLLWHDGAMVDRWLRDFFTFRPVPMHS